MTKPKAKRPVPSWTNVHEARQQAVDAITDIILSFRPKATSTPCVTAADLEWVEFREIR